MRATPRPGDGADWLVLREGRAPRWGGEIRRRHVFGRLAARTGATVLEDGWSDRGLRRATLGPVAGLLPGVVARRLGRSSRPRFASSEKLREAVLRTAVALTDPAVVAVYDDPVAQAATLGIPMDRGWLATLARRQRRNVEAFRWLVVPTASFAELAGLPAERVIVGGNGTDTSAVRAGPWPERPTIGVVSAAAPGRGLELLVEAARLARRGAAGAAAAPLAGGHERGGPGVPRRAPGGGPARPLGRDRDGPLRAARRDARRGQRPRHPAPARSRTWTWPCR